MPRYRQVGIFGVGLLGGSVALALKERMLAEEIHGYDRDPEALAKGIAVGALDQVHAELGSWLGRLELGILAVPVGDIAGLALALAPYASAATLWTDVGSVKAPLVQPLGRIFPRYVGGHPMAGSERAGVENAHSGLLHNAIWALTPAADASAHDVEELKELVQDLRAVALLLEPELHDRLVARVSHLPYLLAVALNLLVDRDPERELLISLAAGGFRDITRVASGSVRMSRDMVSQNMAAVKAALADLRELLDELEVNLASPAALAGLGEQAKRTRDSLPIVQRSLLPRIFDLVVQVPDQPGEVARVTAAIASHGLNIRDIEVLAIREEGGAVRIGFRSQEERDQARQVISAAGYRVAR